LSRSLFDYIKASTLLWSQYFVPLGFEFLYSRQGRDINASRLNVACFSIQIHDEKIDVLPGMGFVPSFTRAFGVGGTADKSHLPYF
jgi:hypothetical protein